jgi:hypothetical protein
MAGGQAAPTAHPVTVKGKVSFRTGTPPAAAADARAKVWLFRGHEALAFQSAEKLRQFEREYPQGLTRVEDRPKEDQTRMTAMVLMTYATVHQESLLSTVPVAADGTFQFQWEGKNPVTIIVESAATTGSYHMPRYAVVSIDPKQPVKPLTVDFGVSHLENHPAAARAGTEGVKG